MLKRKLRKKPVAKASAPVATPGATVLGVYPYARRNPFQRMLYADPGCHDVDIIMLARPDELEAIAAGRPAIAHYHWVHSLFDGMKSPRAVAKAAKQFIAHLDAQKAVGTGIVWTLHNVMSHRSRWPEEELMVREALAAKADIIHVMNPDSAAMTGPLYRLDPERVQHVPHPSYFGVYPAYQARPVARRSLGLKDGEIALLFFGMIEPYKGLRTFLASLDTLQDRLGGRVRALIAGRPSDKDFLAEVEETVRKRNDIRLHAEAVDDQSVQTWFRAADIVMCPYPRGLNSGVAQTAISFGRPVVASAGLQPTLPDIPGAVSVFDPSAPDTFVTATLAAVKAAARPELEAELLEWAARLAPESVSRRFFAMLETAGLLPSDDRENKA
ncbi:glycosyltransferase [Gimibacter soli]|uniref:Glycosyltransferase n=1 Tax=Gimibacter soli TaxID=3024400 RepID=A0AAE9XPZ4_9PROT|nr:glycosyltransferase [Gimibacter soli]WCL55133.1 glycosyltransferase [Gimibacter soli]